MEGYADLFDLPEDERIRVITQAAALGKVVGFVVENDAKADRYIKKLGDSVRVIDRCSGPVKGSILVRVGPRES